MEEVELRPRIIHYKENGPVIERLIEWTKLEKSIRHYDQSDDECSPTAKEGLPLLMTDCNTVRWENNIQFQASNKLNEDEIIAVNGKSLRHHLADRYVLAAYGVKPNQEEIDEDSINLIQHRQFISFGNRPSSASEVIQLTRNAYRPQGSLIFLLDRYGPPK